MPVAVGVRVAVGLHVGVRVAVGLHDGVRLGVGVRVDVLVGVGVRLGVVVGLRVLVGVSVGVGVRLGVDDGRDVAVGVWVGRGGVLDGVRLGDADRVGVDTLSSGVGVLIAVGPGVGVRSTRIETSLEKALSMWSELYEVTAK